MIPMTRLLNVSSVVPFALAAAPPLPRPPRIEDVLPPPCFGLRPQIGFALGEGKRVKPLRARPHNTKAEVVVAKRGRVVAALRDARVRRGEVPRPATEHPIVACIGARGIG